MDSKLQIISGAYRGRKLALPDSSRPTQNRARVALFNMLGGFVDAGANITVWDAFGGSGAFGIECLSRYPAARAIFTDIADASINVIKRNLSGIDALRWTVAKISALDAVKKYGAIADVIFVDPPYADGNLGAIFVEKLARVARAGTIVIWEQDAPNAAAPDANTWDILRQRRYGRAEFYILQRRGE